MGKCYIVFLCSYSCGWCLMGQRKGKRKEGYRDRWLREHKLVSLWLKLDEYRMLESVATSLNMTVKDFILGRINDFKSFYESVYREGYERGFRDAEVKFKITFPCVICGSPITVYPDSQLHREVVMYLRGQGWAHTKCIEESKKNFNKDV